MIAEIYKKTLLEIQDKIFELKTSKQKPSEWVEENIFLTGEVTRFPGYFKYDRSPYLREVIDCLGDSSPVEMVAVMKGSQIGFTAGVLVPFICYTISEAPCNLRFLSDTDENVVKTIRRKLDPVIASSGLLDKIKSADTRKRNQRTGNTDFAKEFSGGNLTATSYKASGLRMESVKIILADEFDGVPKSDKKEGSIRTLLEGRTKSYGNTAKMAYITTPTTKGLSNIEEVYELGDKRKWNWHCPHCATYIPVEWRVDNNNGGYGGIKWELDKESKLIPESIYYECQNCGGKIFEREKYNLNLNGLWIPTQKPKSPNYRSYTINSLCSPPGFVRWEQMVRQWLEANPPGGFVDQQKLMSFINTQLGQIWEERGKTPKSNVLMEHPRNYKIGTIPDNLIKNDGNGKVALLTLACDLGGIMNDEVEDVRIDWEIVAHTTSGQTYSINHGSIGTFKRGRSKTKDEIERDAERIKYTYQHGHRNSVWPYLKKIIYDNYLGESGNVYNIDISIIDTGHFTKFAYDFINGLQDPFVFGIKGVGESDVRAIKKDTPIIKRSRENERVYLLEVNQIKDIVYAEMNVKLGIDGFQSAGFMNFPIPSDGKYTYRNFFKHYESEARIPEMKGEQIVGFYWKKKQSSIENHFWDVRIYNKAAPYIYIDFLRKLDPKNYKNLTWEDFCLYR